MNLVTLRLPLKAAFVPLLFWGTALVALGRSQTESCPAPNPALVQDYLYGYAPVAMEATRAILTAVPDNTTPGQAPINEFAYGEALATPSDHLIVRPNADTLYTGAWLDLRKEPIILHVPDMGSRYYLIPMLDAYSNEFASIGSRTTGNGEGNYAIVGPLWRGFIPDKVNAVITAPTNTVWVLGRTLVNGPEDLQSAIALTKQYQLIPLSVYPEYLETGSYTPPTNVPVTSANPNFLAFPVTDSAGFSSPEFFDVLASYAVVNPPPIDQLVTATGDVLNGLVHQNQLDACVVAQATKQMAEQLFLSATKENGWFFDLKVGNYGSSYALRAAAAKFGFGANIPADAVYMHAMSDGSGAGFSGSNNYVIHFASGQLPPQHGFWSITVYNQDGFLVANPINRYDVGSQTGLAPNADGSLDIYLQSSQPQTHESNWLPIPDGPFSLTLRIYWPDQAVLNGVWMPPPVTIAPAPLP